MNERELGKFPSDKKKPQHEQVKATHRNGKEIQSVAAPPPQEKLHAKMDSSFPLTNEFVSLDDMSNRENELLKQKRAKMHSGQSPEITCKRDAPRSHERS